MFTSTAPRGLRAFSPHIGSNYLILKVGKEVIQFECGLPELLKQILLRVFVQARYQAREVRLREFTQPRTSRVLLLLSSAGCLLL